MRTILRRGGGKGSGEWLKRVAGPRSGIETPRHEDLAYGDAPLAGKPDVRTEAGGMQVRYGRMCGLLMRRLLAAGPVGVREIEAGP